MDWNDEKLLEILKKRGVAVMPTDTIYGIIGRAEDVSVVNRIYDLKKRTPKKPCIILIGDIRELKKFSITLSEEQESFMQGLSLHQDRPTSIILDCFDEKLAYLHRGTNSLAFRLPAPEALRDLLLTVGPLIAPSANPEGLPPAENDSQAKKYFGDSVDLYINGGFLSGKASKLIKLHKDGTVTILRE